MATGNQIDFDNIVVKLIQEFNSCDSDMLLVEGVGGLLAPITRKYTVASLGQKLDSKLIIVVPNQIGVVNHALLTLEVALNRGLSVEFLILMAKAKPDESAVGNAELIRIHMPDIPDFKGVFEFPWLGEDANDPALIPSNIIKAQEALEKISDAFIQHIRFGATNN